MIEHPVNQSATPIPAEDRTEERRAERFAHGIYGTIIVTALLVTLKDHDHTADEIITAVLGTAFVLFLAHAYASALARRFTKRRSPLHSEIVAIIVDNLTLLLAVVVPSLFFVLAAADVISLNTAFWIAIGYALASLFVMGVIYGRSTEHGLPASLILGLTSAGLGGFIIGLETVAH